jgi:hypothetical protein
MTVQTEVNKIVQTADGIQSDFTFNFIVLDESHLQVYLDQTLQTSGYTVAGIGDQSGGSVSFAAPPADLLTVTLIRVVPLSQLTSYQEYDPFPAKTHEAALDALTMIGQQLQEQIDRALTADIGTDPDIDYTFPPYNAGKALMWTETGDKGIKNSTDNFNNIVSNATTQASNAATSASAAATSETNAAASETNAATSETNAAASEAKAQDWAEEDEDVEVETGKYSAKHWAAKSNAFGIDAEASLSISAGAIAWNWATQSEVATVSLTENATLSLPSNFNNRLVGVLRVVQDSTGGRTLGFASGYDAGGIGAIDIETTANEQTMLGFYRVTDSDIKIWEIWRSI